MKFNAKFWQKASNAQEKLESQLNDCPDVCFVDIGYPQNDDTTNGEISLRVHVCEDFDPEDSDAVPTDVDGIPVVVSDKSSGSRRRWF